MMKSLLLMKPFRMMIDETLQDDETFIDDESVSPYKCRKLLVDAIMDEDLDKENLPPNNDSVCKKRGNENC